MDTHTDTAVAEPATETADSSIESLPDASGEDVGFADALESALSKLSGEAPETPVEEAPETPVEEPTEEVPEKTTEEAPENPEPEETKEEGGDDPLADLTEDIDDWTPKAASRFKQLKSELKTNQSEVEQLRQSLKEQESKVKEMSGLVDNKDMDALQQKLETYESERAFTDLESTEAYQKAVTEPLGELLSQVNALADHYDIDPDVLIDAVAMDDQQEQDAAFQKHLPEASDRDRAKLYRIIEDINPILNKRADLVQNSEAALKEARAMEDQKRNEDIAEATRVRKNITQSVVEKVSNKLPFLKGVDSVDMESIQSKASDLDPSAIHPVDFAYNAVAAQLLPTIVREYLKTQKEFDGLTEKLAEYEGAEPSMSGVTPTDKGSPSSELSFTEAINAALGS